MTPQAAFRGRRLARLVWMLEERLAATKSLVAGGGRGCKDDIALMETLLASYQRRLASFAVVEAYRRDENIPGFIPPTPDPPDAARLARESRAAQGLAATVEDADTLRRVAQIVMSSRATPVVIPSERRPSAYEDGHPLAQG